MVDKTIEERVSSLTAFLDTLPDISEYRYHDEDGYNITNEWLCGCFAGRDFIGNTQDEATSQLIEYFDRHVGHNSLVGKCVTEAGWPSIAAVSNYVEQFYRDDSRDD